MNVLEHKWVFKKKPLDDTATIFLCKALCVARGDLQKAFLDYDPDSLYAPVAAHESLRVLIAFAANNNQILEGGDVANAYLYGSIDTPVFMEHPTSSTGIESHPGYVCELDKSIYGVLQAANLWGSSFHQRILSWGFKASHFDVRIYFLRRGSSFIILAIVVDDMSFVSNDRNMLEHFKNKLRATFDVKLFGPLRNFIGWSIIRSPHGIMVHQAPYVRKLLEKYGMQHANVVLTPLPTNASHQLLPAFEDEPHLSKQDHSSYRAIVGGILYLAVCTRPDLSFAIGALARQMHAPTMRHFRMLKRVLRYIAGTRNLVLHYARVAPLETSALLAAVDSDWGGIIESRRSTTGYLVSIHDTPVYWRSKRQTVITLSSGEAEYVALSTCAKDVTWIRKFFTEICTQTPWSESNTIAPTTVEIDSTAGASIASNQNMSARNKHISLKYHHLR